MRSGLPDTPEEAENADLGQAMEDLTRYCTLHGQDNTADRTTTQRARERDREGNRDQEHNEYGPRCLLR